MPLFGVFLGAIILAIGAFVLWLEMVIRDAAIYIASSSCRSRSSR